MCGGGPENANKVVKGESGKNTIFGIGVSKMPKFQSLHTFKWNSLNSLKPFISSQSFNEMNRPTVIMKVVKSNCKA